MKIVTGLFADAIEIEEGEISTLIIENQRTMRKFITDLYDQTKGEEGDIVLSEDNTILKISKKIELITVMAPFMTDRKKILSRVVELMEKEAMNEAYYEKAMKLMTQIELFMDDLSDILPCTLEYSNINIASLVKMCGISIVDDSCSDVERVLNYMSLVRELVGEKLFVFVNMRAFFDDEEMKEFIEMAIIRKFYVFLVENREYEKIKGEKRLIVDKDLCII